MNIVWNAFWGNLNIKAACPPDARLNERFVFTFSADPVAAIKQPV